MNAFARRILPIALLLALPATAFSSEPSKPIQVVINAVRYGKDRLALRQFAADSQAKLLLGDGWAKGTPAQRKQFEELFQTLFAKVAFPKIREDFKYLDAVTYPSAAVKGDQAIVNAVLVVHHPIKGTLEYKPSFRVAQEGGAWKIVDVTMMGDSMLKDAKDQIQDLLKEGGWPHLLDVMRQKAEQLKGVPLK